MITRVLTDEQITRIHGAALEVLAETGVRLPHRETLERFDAAGAEVDFEHEALLIPADLVVRSLGTAGKRFTIYGRDTSFRASFGTGERNYNAIAGEASWVEVPGGPRRYTLLSDVAEAALVCDALPHINIAGAMADPSDVPAAWRCVAVAAELLKHTSKPVTFWFHDRPSARRVVDLAVALRGSEDRAESYPPFYPFLEPISPLHFPFNGVDLLYETARINLPVPIGPMAQTGISAPGTLAATMVQEHAEILAGICITQLIREGTPVCYGGICHGFDMRTTQMIFGGPEQLIFGVAMTQLGKHLGLPVYINVGLTDSKLPDAQAGLEIGATLAAGAAAGADIFGHMGIAGVDQAASLDMLVLQNEIIGYVESSLREIDVDDESLGLSEIAEVGPRGTFIDRRFTAEHCRDEIWTPRILDREFYDTWKHQGSRSTAQVVAAETARIKQEHQPEPPPESVRKALDEIVAAARQDGGTT